MKNINFTIIFYIFSISVFSQEEKKIYDYTYTIDEYNSKLAQAVDNIVTRGDELTLFLDEFSFASNKIGTYYSDVTIKFHEIDPDNNSRKIREINSVINELININSQKQSFTQKFKTLLYNENIENVYQIEINLTLTRLSATQEKEFNRLFKGITSKLPGPDFIKNILKIDENITPENKDKISMPVSFYIPLNFLEHYKLNESVPMLKDNDIVYVAIPYTILPETTNTNLKSWFKNKINKVAKFVTGDQIIKDKNLVTGIAKFRISKETNFSLPNNIKLLMNDLIEEILKNNSKQVDTLILEIEKITKNYKSEGYISQRTKDNIFYFTNLANVYNSYLINKAKPTHKQSDRTIFMNFVSWYDRAKLYSINWQFTTIKINDIYEKVKVDRTDPNRRSRTIKVDLAREANLILPYSVDNPFIVAASNWQMKLHFFCKSVFSKNSDFKDELNEITTIEK